MKFLTKFPMKARKPAGREDFYSVDANEGDAQTDESDKMTYSWEQPASVSSADADETVAAREEAQSFESEPETFYSEPETSYSFSDFSTESKNDFEYARANLSIGRSRRLKRKRTSKPRLRNSRRREPNSGKLGIFNSSRSLKRRAMIRRKISRIKVLIDKTAVSQKATRPLRLKPSAKPRPLRRSR
jgi:hypothetical protein